MISNTGYSNYQTSSVRSYMMKTFLWMALGLVVTTIVAYWLNMTGMVLTLYLKIPMLGFILLIAQLGVAISMGARLAHLSTTSMKFLFMVYSMLTGITFSTLTFAYTLDAIVIAFGITALYFGCLAFIGYTTKFDLTRVGNIFIMGLVVLIVVEGLMMLFHMNIYTKALSALGLLIFTGITAYDVQRLKKDYMQFANSGDLLDKVSIYGAFQMYLDFINIFLYILRFVQRSDD